jgi:uncharacterized OsmC-like protein
MKISATIRNSHDVHDVRVTTNDKEKTVIIPGKTGGYGSSINGGELLFLSLATCFCNDVYREAPRRNMLIESVEVTVSGDFGREGEPASSIAYVVKIESPASTQHEIDSLIQHVDKLAEIHNTLRRGMEVRLIANND